MKGNIGVEFDHMNLDTHRSSFEQAVSKLKGPHQNQQPNYMLYFVRKLSSLLPNCTLVDIGKVTARQRMIKSKEEIEVDISWFLPQTKITVANSSAV